MHWKRSHTRLGLLLAAVVALAGLVFWQWRAAHARATLLCLDPAAVTRIDVTWQGGGARHYRRRDGHWYLAGDPAQRIADTRAAELARLAATPVLSWRKARDMRPASIGLARPAVVIELDGHRLAYGTLAALGPQRFVRVGQRIAIIPASYSPRPPDAASPVPPSSQKS